MDITKMTITELKALAYDQLVELERVQTNIKAINEQIRKRPEEKKVEENK